MSTLTPNFRFANSHPVDKWHKSALKRVQTAVYGAKCPEQWHDVVDLWPGESRLTGSGAEFSRCRPDVCLVIMSTCQCCCCCCSVPSAESFMRHRLVYTLSTGYISQSVCPKCIYLYNEFTVAQNTQSARQMTILQNTTVRYQGRKLHLQIP